MSVGTLSNGSMFYQYYDPGQKTFNVRSPSFDGSDLITLDIVAGETYFVRGEILWGWPAGRPKFSRPSESQALSDIGKLWVHEDNQRNTQLIKRNPKYQGLVTGFMELYTEIITKGLENEKAQ